MPTVAQMLAQAGAAPDELAAIAVAVGPGSFTGLRVGLAAAKGLALAHRLPLLGIPTLDFVAYPHQAQPVPVIAVIQAGRGRVYWAPYADGPGGWAAQEAPVLSTLQALANTVVRPVMFVGEITPADQAALTQWIGRARRASCHRLWPCAGRATWPSWPGRATEAGEADDLATLSPIYLQQPDGSMKAGAGVEAIGGRP